MIQRHPSTLTTADDEPHDNAIDRHRKLPTWEVIQFNLHLKYQKVLFISF